MPTRIQCSRQRPWQTTPKAIYVGRRRGSRFHNPSKIGVDGTREDCIRLFVVRYQDDTADRAAVQPALAGKTLACWCALDQLCHADVLLCWAQGHEYRFNG